MREKVQASALAMLVELLRSHQALAHEPERTHPPTETDA